MYTAFCKTDAVRRPGMRYPAQSTSANGIFALLKRLTAHRLNRTRLELSMDEKFDHFDGNSTSEDDSSTQIGPQRSELQHSGTPAISSESTLFRTITEQYIAEVTSRSKDMEDRWSAAKDKLHERDYIIYDLRWKLKAAKRSGRLSKFLLLILIIMNALLIRNGTLSVDIIKKTFGFL